MITNRRHSVFWFVAALFVAAFWGGGQLGACQAQTVAPPCPQTGPATCFLPAPTAGTPVAKVGNTTITVEQLQARLVGPAERRPAEKIGALRDLRDDAVRFELLAQAALRRHLDHDPQIIDAARKMMVRKLLEEDMQPNRADAAAAGLAARAYYDKHRSSYLLPEKRRFSQIELPHTPAGRAQAQGLIDRMRRHHDLSQTFRAMAAKFSRDPTTVAHGGDEPFETYDEISRGFGAEVATAIFSHDAALIGKALVVQPVESRRGWHVVYVAARREALVREFAEVEDAIHARLAVNEREKKFAAYLDALRQTTPVELFDAPLEKLAAHRRLEGIAP